MGIIGFVISDHVSWYFTADFAWTEELDGSIGKGQALHRVGSMVGSALGGLETALDLHIGHGKSLHCFACIGSEHCKG